MSWEYKSFYRQHKPGEPYLPVGADLDVHGADNWELVSVVTFHGIYTPYVYEIFYLKRETPTTPSATYAFDQGAFA